MTRPSRPGVWPAWAQACTWSLVALLSITANGRSATDVRIHVAVVDAAGRPMMGLTVRDFIVKVDNHDEKVSSVRAATDPVSLVFVVDADVPYVPTMQAAFRAVLDTLTVSGRCLHVGVVHAAKPPAALVPFEHASSLEALIATVNGYPLLQGITEAARALEPDSATQRVVFALDRFGPETEDLDVGDVARALGRANAALWGVQVSPVSATGTSPVERTLTSVTRLTGGMCKAVLDLNGVEPASRDLARLLTAEYVVSIEVPAAAAHGELRVGVARAGPITVLAPARLPQ
jgi:hypothetical protein